MYYKVKYEQCGKGINSRFNENQIIDDKVLKDMENDLSNYRLTLYDDLKMKKYEYNKFGLFNEYIFIYSVYLEKLSKK